MAEDKNIDGQQLQSRLQRLVDQWLQGKTSLKQIVGLSDEELYAFASQGYYFFLQGKIEAARVIFEGLVAADPRNNYYYRALGAIYWRLKEAQKAIKQFTYAIRVAPNDMTSYVNRAEVYVSLRQFEAAKSDLDYVIRLATANEEALVRKAQAIVRMIGG